MSAPINDGGPMFAIPGIATNWYATMQTGISIRDYLAGQALAGALADPTCDLSPIELAKKTYEFADAMLAAREVKQ